MLEVGCHQGASTVLMGNIASQAVGVDKGQHVLAEARRLHPHLRFEGIDAGDMAALRRLAAECRGFSVVCVDIGGGSTASVSTLWRLVESYGACLAPRLFIVKAFKLAELLRRCEGVDGGGG